MKKERRKIIPEFIVTTKREFIIFALIASCMPLKDECKLAQTEKIQGEHDVKITKFGNNM